MSAQLQPDGELIMKSNVGGIDKILRIAVGLGLVAWALMGGPVWAWLGVVFLATGLLNWCPAYTLLGMNTCPTKK
jgi:hypothetical protein